MIRPCFPNGLKPRRITTGPLVLWRSDIGAGVIARPDGTVLVEVDDAYDIDAGPDGLLVISGRPGRPMRRFQIEHGDSTELEPLEALDFDGEAVAIAPNGRIGFTTDTVAGIGWTSGSAARHMRDGTITSYRFDSGNYRTRWGRVLMDGCLPAGTSVGLRFITTDSDDPGDPIPASPPDRGHVAVPHAELTPPLPPQYLLDEVAGTEYRQLYRRPASSALTPDPWATAPDFVTYDTPVRAAPGRYLWVQILLHGTERVSPRVAAIRIERPGHALLGNLPRSWSRDAGPADFLQQLLAPAEGMVHELDQQAAHRERLLSARATPTEALSWLASLAGLALDKRWSEAASRTLIAEAYQLFRRRGTAATLVRILEIFLGYPPTVIEQWQLRGLGGAVLGTRPLGQGQYAAPALGGSAELHRNAGAVHLNRQQRFDVSVAHRFHCADPRHAHSDEHRSVVEQNPCRSPPRTHPGRDLRAGQRECRLGTQLRVGLSSYVGAPRNRLRAQLGGVSVASDSVLGEAADGSRVGETTTVGKVRVG